MRERKQEKRTQAWFVGKWNDLEEPAGGEQL